jgi:iron-sulfur cluster assembly protein
MNNMETTVVAPVNFTKDAVVEIKRLMNEDGFDKTQLLRVGVKGGGCSGMTYVLGFDVPTDKDEYFEVPRAFPALWKDHTVYI